MCEECGETATIGAAGLSWWDPIGIALFVGEGIFGTIAGAFGSARVLVQMHSNMLAEREQFKREAGFQIERIIDGP